MTVIVEDGSIVAGANSFVTIADVQAYASARGFSITTDETKIEIGITLSIDYMRSKNYIGDLVDDTQPLPFPRKNIDNVLDTEIPGDIKNAQVELVIASFDDELLSRSGGANITREKVGELETEYAGQGLSNSFTSQRVNMYLAKYIRPFQACRI